MLYSRYLSLITVAASRSLDAGTESISNIGLVQGGAFAQLDSLLFADS